MKPNCKCPKDGHFHHCAYHKTETIESQRIEITRLRKVVGKLLIERNEAQGKQ